MELNLHRSWAEIDLDQLRRNYEIIKGIIPEKTKIMAVLKADAYGCGDTDCAAALNCYPDDWYGVASLNEALRVREASEKHILILTYTNPQFVDVLIEERLTQTIVSTQYAGQLSAAAEKVGRPVDVHIKLDTGMNRIGICAYKEHWKDAVKDVEKILQDPWLNVTGVFTHVTTTYEYNMDDAMRHFADEQLASFLKVTDELKNMGYDIGLRHACNSGGIANIPKLRELDMVRAGNILYGIYPQRCYSGENPFKNVMSLKAEVLHVKNVEAGQYYSYSMTGYAGTQRRVATVSIGYADGYKRCLGNIGRVLINGCSCTILGRVCMDQIIVDVTNVGNVEVGDEVVLIGRQGNKEILIDEISKLAQTGAPEITCLFTRRVQKIYFENGRPAYRTFFKRMTEKL